MIIGIGTDIIKIARLADVIAHEQKLRRLFSEAEIQTAPTGITRLAYFAKRFAAKEACAKAIGIGITSEIGHVDIQTLNNHNGAPYITLSERALSSLRLRFSSDVHFFVSLSDEEEYAIAMVIAEVV